MQETLQKSLLKRWELIFGHFVQGKKLIKKCATKNVFGFFAAKNEQKQKEGFYRQICVHKLS